MGIFSQFAPKYWDAGLQVMPLLPRTKRPFLEDWQDYTHNAVPQNTRDAWVASYSDYNIGLCAGPISGVSFVDLDIADPELLAKVRALLPPSPWTRVGAKGCVLAYKWSNAKSFKLFEDDEHLKARGPGAVKVGFEFFATSGQIVLPPSIHPDTGKPYISDTDLWEVMPQLSELDGELLEGKMRVALAEFGIKTKSTARLAFTGYVSKGSRDVTMIRMAGMYASDIRRGLKTLREALEELEVWGKQFAEQDDADSVDTAKGQQRIIQYLISDVMEKHFTLPKGWDAGIGDEQRKELGLEVFTEEFISLDFGEIKSQFLERLKSIELEGVATEENQLKAIDKALFQAAHSKDCSTLEIERLFEIIRAGCGKKSLPVAALRKLFKRHQSTGIEGLSHAEIANAVLKDWSDFDIRFDHGRLWEWWGTHWREKTEAEVLKHIADNYGGLPAARKHSDTKGIFKTICILAQRNLKDREGAGINFANGHLGTDLRLTAHDKEYGLTYEMPYRWTPEVGPPVRFLKYLNAAFEGDPEVVQFLREAIAVSLFGLGTTFHRCFLLYGVPDSGKSVFIDILSSMFPGVCRVALPPAKWNENFMTCKLDGPLINVCGELSEKTKIDGEMFKKVVVGEELTGRHLFAEGYQFKPVCSHWFASNHMPLTEDTSAGFTKRWIVAAFKKRVRAEDIDRGLAASIIGEERERIVAWAVSSIGDVLERGSILEPASSAAQIASLSANLNPIRGWFGEKVELKEDATLTEDTAYDSYCMYALTRQMGRKLSRVTFRSTMEEQASIGGWKCISQRDGSQKYVGIKIQSKTAK